MGMDLDEIPTTSSVSVEVDDVQFQAIVRSWILRALSKEDPERYRKLLIDIKYVDFNDALSVTGLSIRLRALSESVSFINEHDHEVLLSHILYMSFWNCSSEVADALHDLVVNLATSNGVLVSKCLDMLVRNFLPPSCGIKMYVDSYTEESLARKKMTFEDLKAQKAMHLARKSDVMNRVHLAIRRIVKLVPTAAFRLHPIVQQRMPHRTVDKEWNALYLENMLMLDSARMVGSRLLFSIVDRLIEIDVEIAWEDILKDEDGTKVLLFHMDLDENEEKPNGTSGDPGGPGSEAHLEHTLTAKRRSSLDEVAEKMDLLMDLTLQHLQVSVKNGRVDEIYDALMVSFQSTVLETHKSKFTQFLVFYLCSLAPTTCGTNFAGFLCETFINRSMPLNTRMSAAAYLASYLARAKFLPLSIICSSIARLVNWCVSYTPSNFDGFKIADAGLHGVFYSACQAVMYVLCFRLKELHEDGAQRSLLRNLRLQQLIEHKLRPLKVCLPSVVEEFLRQATALQLIRCNNLSELSSSLEVLSSKTFGGEYRLDMFFPFDPYLLRISDRFIRPNFIFWSMVQPANEVDDDDDEGSDEDEDDEPVVEDGDQLHGSSPDYNGDSMMAACNEEDTTTTEAFRSTLECMSITPPRMLPANLSFMLPIA